MRKVQRCGGGGPSKVESWSATLFRIVVLSIYAFILGCAPMPSAIQPSAEPESAIRAEPPGAPASHSNYATDAISSPPPAGETETTAERSVVRFFRERGDTARGDGRLVQLAEWAARRTRWGETPNNLVLDAMSRRLGHVGPVPWALFVHGGRISERDIDDRLRTLHESLPRNIPITRYGIAVTGRRGDEMLVIVFASLELEIEPVPKQLGREQPIHLAGRVADRFERVQLSITFPNGKVRSFNNADRQFRADFVATDIGVHRIELLGQGTTGPVVIANFPVYVGVDETEPPALVQGHGLQSNHSAPASPAVAEQRMLTLMAAAREKDNLPTLAVDDELSAIALAHSTDMADHGFFGHISPSTGAPEERIRRANVHLMAYGENVARGPSPEQAHETLMESPGHREVMLHPEFTHVGIGAVIRSVGIERQVVLVTLVFGRRGSERSRQ